MSDPRYFQVTVPVECRAKLERLAAGSRRKLGNVVALLIATADEHASEWNVLAQSQEQEQMPAPAAEAQP